jgi:hypothetical protein
MVLVHRSGSRALDQDRLRQGLCKRAAPIRSGGALSVIVPTDWYHSKTRSPRCHDCVTESSPNRYAGQLGLVLLLVRHPWCSVANQTIHSLGNACQCSGRLVQAAFYELEFMRQLGDFLGKGLPTG